MFFSNTSYSVYVYFRTAEIMLDPMHCLSTSSHYHWQRRPPAGYVVRDKGTKTFLVCRNAHGAFLLAGYVDSRLGILFKVVSVQSFA